MIPQQVPVLETIGAQPAAVLPTIAWDRVAFSAVEEASDSVPALRRLTVLTMLVGSVATWAAIGLAGYQLLF
jgi:hypothetical protein